MSPRLSAITVAFVANGAGVPSFLARLPERKSRLDLSDGELGLVLTGLAMGAFAASPVAGRLVDRYGSRPVLVASACALGGTLPLLAVTPSAPTLFASLIAVGAADAAMDIAMNANGAAYEHRLDRSVMHRLHAWWSIGALAAAAFAGLLAATQVPPGVHLAAVGLALAVSSAACRRSLAPDVAVPARGGRGRSGILRRPHQLRILLALLLLAAGAAIVEGAPADWASVRLAQSGASHGWATSGLGAFMLGMVVGRLVGDRLIDRRGTRWVVRVGMALVAFGYLSGSALASPVIFVLSLVIVGFGAGWYVPVLFSASARISDVEAGLGVAAVSLGVRTGFLVEPLIVGGIAELGTLRQAFPAIAVVALGLGLAASRLPAERGSTVERRHGDHVVDRPRTTNPGQQGSGGQPAAGQARTRATAQARRR